MRAWTRQGAAALAAITLLGAGVAGASAATSRDEPVRYRDRVADELTRIPALTYGSAPSRATGEPEALVLDLYEPAGDTVAARPAAIYAHGGGFVGGDRGDSGVAEDLAHRGYVAVSIDYRLKAGGGCDAGGGVSDDCYGAAADAIADAKAAVRWLRANATTYGIDPTRIAMAGSSAGAIMATGVALTSEDPGTSGNPGPSSAIGAFSSFSGGLPGGAGASADDPPGVLLSGTEDTVVPYQWSVDTASALQSVGVAARLITLQGQGHTPSSAQGQFVSETASTFYDALDLAHAEGSPGVTVPGPTTPTDATTPTTTPTSPSATVPTTTATTPVTTAPPTPLPPAAPAAPAPAAPAPVGPPPAAFALRPTLASTGLARVRARGLAVRPGCSTRCALRLVVRSGGRTLAVATRTAVAPGATVTARLSAGARARLARRTSVRIAVTVTARVGAATATRRLGGTLRRP